jgi:hypothetical protein
MILKAFSIINMGLTCTNNLFVCLKIYGYLSSRSQNTCVTFDMMNLGVNWGISFQRWGLVQENSAIMSSMCTVYIQVYTYMFVYMCNGLYAVRILCFFTYTVPITVATPSKACTLFARSKAGIVRSNPTQSTVVCVCACVCVALCVGSFFAKGWSPVQGALQSV